MRFNRRDKFNVPYCHKDSRFAQAYITKIVNQVRSVAEIVTAFDWEFRVSDFNKTLDEATSKDFIYADPPYTGRHVDYFNSWSGNDENSLAARLKQVSCKFILSTWHSNEFRQNLLLHQNWEHQGFHIFTRKHFYHVGSSEALRHPMVEALITNFSSAIYQPVKSSGEQLYFLEEIDVNFQAV